MNILSSIMQKIFFRHVKAKPNRRWKERAKSLGAFHPFNLSRSGKKLSCYQIIPKNPVSEDGQGIDIGNRLVIFSHPISRKGKYFFSDSERAQTYLQRGFSVIAFDYNGFGESDSIDLFYWRDVAAVIDYAKKNFPGYEIVLHGTSFGAFHIVRALEYLPYGAEVVLENVNKSLLNYWRRWPTTGLLVRVLELLRIKAIQEMDVQSVVRKFQRQDLHIQFIACENDHLTTLAEMRELFEQLATENKSFAVFTGAGHLAAPGKDPALYQTVLFNRGCRPC